MMIESNDGFLPFKDTLLGLTLALLLSEVNASNDRLQEIKHTLNSKTKVNIYVHSNILQNNKVPH